MEPLTSTTSSTLAAPAPALPSSSMGRCYYDLHLQAPAAAVPPLQLCSLQWQSGFMAVAHTYTFAALPTPAERTMLQQQLAAWNASHSSSSGAGCQASTALVPTPPDMCGHLGVQPSSSQPLQRLHLKGMPPAQVQQVCGDAGLLAAFDLVSVEPTTEQGWQQALGALPVDLVTLPLMDKLPFKLKAQELKEAVARGVHFEVCYGEALANPYLRPHFLANARRLVQLLHGKHLVVSSGAADIPQLRAPQEVVALSTALDLTPAQAEDAISSAPRKAVQHAAQRTAGLRPAAAGC